MYISKYFLHFTKPRANVLEYLHKHAMPDKTLMGYCSGIMLDKKYIVS